MRALAAVELRRSLGGFTGRRRIGAGGDRRLPPGIARLTDERLAAVGGEPHLGLLGFDLRLRQIKVEAEKRLLPAHAGGAGTVLIPELLWYVCEVLEAKKRPGLDLLELDLNPTGCRSGDVWSCSLWQLLRNLGLNALWGGVEVGGCS